jgi:hypothetical protein
MISILFVVTSQILGYGIAGIMRKFLVWPSAMIWPANLVNCALFRTLHNRHEKDKSTDSNSDTYWTMSRLRFFFLASLCQFLWFWLPGYIFPVLSLFSWICMMKPNNVIVSQLTGINGLGIGSIELDWNAWVSFLGSPIIVPFWFVQSSDSVCIRSIYVSYSQGTNQYYDRFRCFGMVHCANCLLYEPLGRESHAHC